MRLVLCILLCVGVVHAWTYKHTPLNSCQMLQDTSVEDSEPHKFCRTTNKVCPTLDTRRVCKFDLRQGVDSWGSGGFVVCECDALELCTETDLGFGGTGGQALYAGHCKPNEGLIFLIVVSVLTTVGLILFKLLLYLQMVPDNLCVWFDVRWKRVKAKLQVFVGLKKAPRVFAVEEAKADGVHNAFDPPRRPSMPTIVMKLTKGGQIGTHQVGGGKIHGKNDVEKLKKAARINRLWVDPYNRKFVDVTSTHTRFIKGSAGAQKSQRSNHTPNKPPTSSLDTRPYVDNCDRIQPDRDLHGPSISRNGLKDEIKPGDGTEITSYSITEVDERTNNFIRFKFLRGRFALNRAQFWPGTGKWMLPHIPWEVATRRLKRPWITAPDAAPTLRETKKVTYNISRRQWEMPPEVSEYHGHKSEY